MRIKPGDIVKFKGDFGNYTNFFVLETFTNDRENGDDLALVSFKEPQTYSIRTMFVATASLQHINTEQEKKA